MSDADRHYQSILHCLQRLRGRAVLVGVASGLISALAAGLALGLVWVGLEALLYLPPLLRSGLGAGVVVGLLAVLVHQLWRLAARLPLARLGLFVEQRCPELQQRLISVLELWHSPRARQLYSGDLLRATVARTAALMAALDARRVVELGELKAPARSLGLVVLLAAGCYAGFTAALDGALHRCSRPLTHFVRQPPTRIAVEPGDLEVIRGEDAVLKIRFTGALPRAATVLRQEAETAPWLREEIVVDRADSLVYTFKHVKRPFSYQIRANGGHSAIHDVAVLDPPSIQRLRLKFEYPAYSGLSPRVEEASGDIHALAGTRVEFELNASKPLRSATLVLGDSLRRTARTEDHTARVALQLASSGHYHFELVDRKGISNRDPIRYAIRILEDTPPRVVITDPGRDMDLPESLRLTLAAEAGDDFGVERVELVHRLNEGEEERLALALEPGRDVTLSHLWDLSATDLLPEDRIHYQLEAYDNDRISGPKRSVSRQYVLRFPSLYELYEEVATEQEAQLDALAELAEEGRKNQEYLEQVRRELLKTDEMSWEQKKELEATLARETERAEAVQDLAEELERTLEALEENDLAPGELLEKLAQIRELLAAVASPELLEALEGLQQAVENPDSGSLAEALSQFREDQEAFQQRLDRTLALLQQVQAEQQLEAVVQQAADLERRQAQIDAELDEGAAAERLRDQEARLQGDTGRLQQDLEELGQTMEQLSEETARDLAAQAHSMEEQALAARMEEMIKQLEQRQEELARRVGAGLEADLGALSAALQRLKGEYVAREKEQLGLDMRHAMHDLLHLSLRQEELRNRTQGLPRPPAGVLAEEQFALQQGAAQVSERLGRVSRKTMSLSPGLGATMGYALQNMREAARRLAQKEIKRSGEPQQSAMGHLNEAVLLMRESLDNLSSASMPSSFAEAMQQMMGLAEQQADLNQATQQAMGLGRQPGESGRPSGDPGAQMSRLAAEQQQIRQALAALEQAMRGHRGAQRRVRAIEKEMESVLRDLQRRRPSERTLGAQKRIHQRMLDASRSIHTRGFEEKRRAGSGRDQAYSGPAWLPGDLGQSYDRLREAMKAALEGPYPDEYRPLIRHYFEVVYQDLIEREGATGP